LSDLETGVSFLLAMRLRQPLCNAARAAMRLGDPRGRAVTPPLPVRVLLSADAGVYSEFGD